VKKGNEKVPNFFTEKELVAAGTKQKDIPDNRFLISTIIYEFGLPNLT